MGATLLHGNAVTENKFPLLQYKRAVLSVRRHFIRVWGTESCCFKNERGSRLWIIRICIQSSVSYRPSLPRSRLRNCSVFRIPPGPNSNLSRCIYVRGSVLIFPLVKKFSSYKSQLEPEGRYQLLPIVFAAPLFPRILLGIRAELCGSVRSSCISVVSDCRPEVRLILM
jgi:hypothetical protein